MKPRDDHEFQRLLGELEKPPNRRGWVQVDWPDMRAGTMGPLFGHPHWASTGEPEKAVLSSTAYKLYKYYLQDLKAWKKLTQ